jgi:hypothetical protein
MSIKCVSCGLVNWGTANACRRCNTPIQAQGITAPAALPQIQRSFQPPQPPVHQTAPQAQPPHLQQPIQRPVFQPPAGPSASVPEANPHNQQPFIAGQQQPMPIHRPGFASPMPIHRPGQEAGLAPPQAPQTDFSAPVSRPSDAWPAAQNGGAAINRPAIETYPNHLRPNPQGLPNQANGVQPPAPYTRQQGYPPYPQGNQPYSQPQNGQPYGNPVQEQAYPPRQPYTGYPGAPNQPPYQTTFAPPQSYPPPYAPGRGYAPPPPFTASKSSLGPVAKTFITLIVIGAVVGFGVLRALLNRERTESMGEEALTVKYLKVPNRDSASIEGMRENFFSYLGKDRDARFGYDEMQRQLFSGIEQLIYDKEKGEVLFLVRDCSDADPTKMQRIIDRYAIDPAAVSYGEAAKPKVVSFRARNQVSVGNNCPLVIPIDNIRINPYSSVEIKYSSATYKISAQELADYMTDKSIFSGPMRIFSKDRVQRELNVFGNHGAFVARPNEPSLTRLANSLIIGGSAASRETKIQQLLNFVSGEITYDDAEAKFKGEILKRPDETLLTRRGDCSSKTILMASLLEQIGEDYRLVYYIDHITVAVRRGDFNIPNNLSFAREGETWVIAETTVPGFVIGETSIENKSIFRNIQYIQRPGTTNDVSAFDNLKEIFLQ